MTDDKGDKTVEALIELMGELETVEEMAYQLRRRLAELSLRLVKQSRH